ncbi:MAG TPA: RnfH family protein [Steroidobacteraceae bacterium]|jgi:hypothetical protein
MPADELLRVCVVYALAQRQIVVELKLEPQATVADAIARSGLPRRYPQIANEQLNCAVFGRVVALSDTLRDGDRVEILRPLLIDPKERRRQAAAKAGRKS